MDIGKVLFDIMIKNDPLKGLVQYFGNASMEKWLEIGFGEALAKDLDAIDNSRDNYVVLECFHMVNAIIPPVPHYMDEELGTISFEGCLIHSDLNQVSKLITHIIKPVLSQSYFLLHEYEASKVLLKTVYYATENVIKDDISDDLVEFCSRLLPCCNASNHTVMALITILAKKMPYLWFQNFLEPRILFLLRMVVMRSEEKMCPYVDRLRNLYSELNLEQKFQINVPTWKELLETSQMFQEDSLVTALRCVSQLISDGNVCRYQLIMSDLLYTFHNLLCNPSKIGDQTLVIRSFLTVFLSFETGADNHYEWKSILFEKLVVLVRDTTEFLLLTNKERQGYRKVHRGYPLTTIDRFKNEATLGVELLESLYVLNSSWYQWFDIVKENKIIDVSLFMNLNITYSLHRERRYNDSEKYPWLLNLLKICPAFDMKEFRFCIFEEENMKKKNSGSSKKCFEVRRSDVLNDIFDIFSQNVSCIDDHWDFVFKGEIAQDPGVTKEVYSILSQELQRHTTGLWQGHPNKGSGNEVKCTYLRDGLVPHVSKETQSFKLLGKIMAKAILDEQLLDIPLSNEFFQRLLTTHLKNYSHLKREYFDLLQTFPMLESLFKQILPVKRKIELIRTEVGLTQLQKQEIISNLTFDDGSSFDDLCLNFTVPGTDVELIEGGHDILLSPYNIDSYFEKLCAFRAQFDPVNQFKAIREGFDEVLFPGSVDLLLPEELKELFCSYKFQRWTLEDLQNCCKYDSSQSVQFLFETLSSLDTKSQRYFLKFVTGMTSLPSGGLRSLNPPLTISRLNCEHPDSYFPTSATCFNLLRLPEYSSLHVTRAKLVKAIHDGRYIMEFYCRKTIIKTSYVES